MAALRSASEQQLPDCLSFAGVGGPGKMNAPTTEQLMTLLWAIRVLEKERQANEKLMTPELDAATEVRQLGDMFRHRNVTGKGVLSFMAEQPSVHGGEVAAWAPESQKSLEGWRKGVQ